MPWSHALNATNSLNTTSLAIMEHVDGFNISSNWWTRFPLLNGKSFLDYLKINSQDVCLTPPKPFFYYSSCLMSSLQQAAAGMLFESVDTINSTFTINMTTLWNPDTVHALPSYINAIDQALMRYLVNDTKKTYSIRTYNYPFPQPDSFIFNANGQIYFGFIVIIAFAILPAGAAVFIVQVSPQEQFQKGNKFLIYRIR